MQELLDFVEQKIELGFFIGLSVNTVNDQFIYTVDYWESKTETNIFGKEVEIKAGNSQEFTL